MVRTPVTVPVALKVFLKRSAASRISPGCRPRGQALRAELNAGVRGRIARQAKLQLEFEVTDFAVPVDELVGLERCPGGNLTRDRAIRDLDVASGDQRDEIAREQRRARVLGIDEVVLDLDTLNMQHQDEIVLTLQQAQFKSSKLD